MIRLEATVTLDNGPPLEAVIDLRDQLAWEQAHPGRSIVNALSDPSMTDLVWLAHHALTRTGQWNGGGLDELHNRITDLTMTAAGRVDPTPGAPPTGSPAS